MYSIIVNPASSPKIKNVNNVLFHFFFYKGDGLLLTNVLGYSTHEDPQLRGQSALLACSILTHKAEGQKIWTVEHSQLVAIIHQILKDKESSACRLAVQGLQHCLPRALETKLSSEVIPLLNCLVTVASNPYWLVKVDLLDLFGSLPWITLEFTLGPSGSHMNFPMFQKTFLGNTSSFITHDDHS